MTGSAHTAGSRGTALVARLRWGSPRSPDALFGSELTTAADGAVRLVNPLMPSGTVMQRWSSLTDYQAVREAPTLPLLRHGCRYRLLPELTASPAGRVIFEVRCFDRFDEPLSAVMLHEPNRDFMLPPGCHHTEIRLINRGCDALSFEAFSLLEVLTHE